MSGVIPTELGYLVKVISLDLREYIMILFVPLVSFHLFFKNIIFLIIILNTGDYKSPPQTATKNGGVAIPTELGLLKLWKHVVFGESCQKRLRKTK